VLDGRTGRPIAHFGRTNAGPNAGRVPWALSPDGATLARAASDAHVELFDARTHARRADVALGPTPSPPSVEVYALAYVPGGSLVAATNNAVVRVLDARGAITVSVVDVTVPDCAPVAEADGEHVLYAGAGQIVELDVAHGTHREAAVATDPARAFALAPSSHTLAIGRDQGVELRDAATLAFIAWVPAAGDHRVYAAGATPVELVDPEDRTTVSFDCVVAPQVRPCDAVAALARATTRGVPFRGSPGWSLCAPLGGSAVMGTDDFGNEAGLCRFADGSYATMGTLYAHAEDNYARAGRARDPPR
jgi:hypothetical protein